ncbi:hypothetical protein C0V73_20780 [Rhizobium sp. TH135]|uniref:peptidoglycan-binding domain-containing protein n=1 Tax=Rhizobium sp. TH135 TaxID=2067451 RepID=UPI000C7C02CB|nr:peptidoglycan-binding domain-containing protein [Rhizobium sp. TH135]PLK69212.1 hypothetical protein C0V73_20780 [Rhizobium sp. TH135]
MANKLGLGSVSVALSLAMLVASPGVQLGTGAHSLAGTAQAQGLDGFFKQVEKNLGLDNNKNKKRKKSNTPNIGLDTVLQGVGMGLVAGGVIKGEAGPLIVGTILVAAPVVFQKDMERKYGRDQGWAGCVSCNQKRLLVRPGASVTSAEQAAITARIKDDVRDIQGGLAQLGYYDKKIDGDYGPGTRKAVSLFQQSLFDEPTGKLTAAQRRELFVLAREKGYEPTSGVAKAALMPVVASLPDPALAVSSGSLQNLALAPAVATIKEFKLAESQFNQFAKDALQFGSLTAVKGARLLPDGKVEVVMDTGAVLSNSVGSIELKKHDLSESWIQILMANAGSEEQAVLNTVDSFGSAAEATTWLDGALKKLDLLKKLVGLDETAPAATMVVEAEKPPQMPNVEMAKVDPGAPNTALDVKTPSSPTVANQHAQPVGDTTKVAVATTSEVNAQAKSIPAQCGSDVYVSFNFPKGDKSINHYNIIPPEGTLMMDNGDSTAYFTGNCVQGQYGYKYVVVTHDEKQKKWESSVHEGTFELASLAGQCEVNLDDPNGSATLQCY